MNEYKGSKIEVVPRIQDNYEDNSLKSFQIKGIDNQFYNIKIFLKEKFLIFNVTIVGDFTEIIYSKKFTLEDLYNINRFFRQYLSIEELFKLLFKDLKDKEISICKNDNNIKFSFLVLSRNKKEEVTFLLNAENIDLEKVVIKLCDKIKEITKLNKIKEEQNKIEENSKSYIMKFIESKIFSTFIFLFFIIMNIIFIIYIYKNENDLKNIKKKVLDNKINGYSLKMLIKEVNRKFNKINEKNSNDINNEFNKIKNIILINTNGLKNEINEIKEYNNINLTKNIKDININNNILNKNITEINFFDYYINKNEVFNLINEGIKNKKKQTIKEYKLIFKASRDGFKAIDFHKKCDGKTNTLTLVFSKNGRIFGGFTDVSWDSESDAKEGSNGFIFSLDNKEIYYNINVKFNIRCIADYGPIFGNFDLCISNNCNKNKSFIRSYAYDIHEKENLFDGNKFFYVEDYEVYELELV